MDEHACGRGRIAAKNARTSDWTSSAIRPRNQRGSEGRLPVTLSLPLHLVQRASRVCGCVAGVGLPRTLPEHWIGRRRQSAPGIRAAPRAGCQSRCPCHSTWCNARPECVGVWPGSDCPEHCPNIGSDVVGNPPPESARLRGQVASHAVPAALGRLGNLTPATPPGAPVGRPRPHTRTDTHSRIHRPTFSGFAG
jgi:hypothetical protein